MGFETETIGLQIKAFFFSVGLDSVDMMKIFLIIFFSYYFVILNLYYIISCESHVLAQ